jgi:ABC-type nitrate/sulfonate/bicarbonate transport system substrate-binding protein
VIDARRGDGPAAAFGYTFASIAARSAFVDENPQQAAAIVSAVVAAQNALTQDVGLAEKVGRRLFPSAQADLIVELIRRDLPFYDAEISRDTLAGLSRFARNLGLIDSDLAYERVIAAGMTELWH